MEGIKVIYKDKTVDYFDPCCQIIIDNGAHCYKINVNDIESIEGYVVDNPKEADDE